MTAIDRVLQAFEAACFPPHRCGKGWRVPCPACGTKTLKGSLAVAANGAVLAHWFCGHAPGEVLAVLGLTLADLFPIRDLRSLTGEERTSLREYVRQAQWRAALPVVAEETSIVLMAANQLGDAIALNDADLQRVRLAALRLFDACEVLLP